MRKIFRIVFVMGILFALVFSPNLTGQAQDPNTVSTSCQFQPMPVTRAPTMSSIRLDTQISANLSPDNTYIGLHRWTINQWPGVDYLVDTTLPFKNGGVVSWVGKDGAGGGNSIIIDGTGDCKGWRVFYGHLDYDATSKFKVGDHIGSDEIVGVPGCSGFEAYCVGRGGSLPKHNHTTLGYWSNTFSFTDGTQAANVGGYWWIHPARVEGSPEVITAPQEPRSIEEISRSTEFSVEIPNVPPAGLNAPSFLEDLLIFILPFRAYVLSVLALLAILWIGGTTVSDGFVKGAILFGGIVVLSVVFSLGLVRFEANSLFFTPAREPTVFSVSETSTTAWSVDLTENTTIPPADTTPTITLPLDGSCSLSLNVPQNLRQYCAWIDKYAAQYGIEPRLGAAIMQQECPSGDPLCYSYSGAVGLMQVMASDGISGQMRNPTNGRLYFGDRPTIAQLQDPEFNIMTGMRILREKIDYWGSVREGIRHYGHQTPDNPYYYTDLVMGHYERFK